MTVISGLGNVMFPAKAGGPERRGWGNCMILSVAGTQRGRSPKPGSGQGRCALIPRIGDTVISEDI